MFEWLTEELNSIQTPGFHVIAEGSTQHEEAAENSKLDLANDYNQFVIRYGNSHFFRQARGGYAFGVLAFPPGITERGSVYQVGYDDDEPIHMHCGSQAVFGRSQEKAIADSFGSWLEETYRRIKTQYSPHEWRSIEEGPRAFDRRELAAMDARDKFKWQEVGLDESGDRLIEITNGSDICIPCFTVDVKSSNGRLNGAVIVDVHGLNPGETQTFAIGCYKKFHAPSDLMLHNLPKPRPEDRDFIAELKRLQD